LHARSILAFWRRWQFAPAEEAAQAEVTRPHLYLPEEQ
jgi:hypothetical protein